ncbi:MAG: restriction endonuclease [Deltaproteobacteria bacterium]|nr:restriction endonuclease [Deltaproteobacteria bacterium]
MVDPDNANVDARLRATMRNLSRMWSVDALGPAVDRIIAAAEAGGDITAPQPESEKQAGVFAAVREAAWKAVRERYHGAQFEQLVLKLFQGIYVGGRVEHWGGRNERGADLIVFTQDPLGLEFKIAVQVKLHEGVDDDTRARTDRPGAQGTPGRCRGDRDDGNRHQRAVRGATGGAGGGARDRHQGHRSRRVHRVARGAPGKDGLL